MAKSGGFWSLVDKDTTPCWLWQGGVSRHGYGLAHWQGKRWLAHRLAYTLIWGGIPPKQVLDHLCRNIRCVYPWHLEPVTPAENQRRKMVSRRIEGATSVRAFPDREARRAAWYGNWLRSFKPAFVTSD